jgi:hypothetical protein
MIVECSDFYESSKDSILQTVIVAHTSKQVIVVTLDVLKKLTVI